MRDNNSIPAVLITTIRILFFILILSPRITLALVPLEVVVMANADMKESIDLAQRYILARKIPKENLFQVKLGPSETIERADYDEHLAKPLRNFLTHLHHGSRVRCLVLMYGMPFKVEAPPLTTVQGKKMDQLTQTIVDLRLQLSKINYKSGETEEKLSTLLEKAVLEKRELAPVYRRASVDSELMLVLVEEYALEGWQANPFFLGFRDQKGLIDKNNVLMVSRLDGPNPEAVVRILADTFATEKKGLKGNAYFDARWPGTRKAGNVGYEVYDQSIHQAARRIKKNALMPVVLDEKEALFQPNACPEAALYCGWYSRGSYVPAFTWTRGAVGYHIASGECSALRKAGSQVWCKRMIEEGVAATLGPIEEPYVQAFPLPDIFFTYLVLGKLSLAECYLLSLPYLSWKMVLIGDPLYRPFAVFDQFD